MGIAENTKKIENAIVNLQALVGRLSGVERDNVRDAIARLKVEKAILAGSQWDEFRVEIKDEDFERLEEARRIVEGATAAEKEVVERVGQAVGVVKRILTFFL